jgi:hypothetical protein
MSSPWTAERRARQAATILGWKPRENSQDQRQLMERLSWQVTPSKMANVRCYGPSFGISEKR